MYTYKAYIEKNNSLTVEVAEEIYEKMLESIDLNDCDVRELWKDLIENVLKYAAIRSQWLTYTREQRIEKDPGRTAIHNSLISSFNVLSRYLEKIRKDISWRVQLGDDRKRIGDLACYVAYIYGLNAR